MSTQLLLKESVLVKGAFDFENKEKGVYGTVAKFGNEINIQMIVCLNPGLGYAQSVVRAFQKVAKENDMILSSSVPIHPAWRHICEKYGIKIYEDHDKMVKELQIKRTNNKPV